MRNSSFSDSASPNAGPLSSVVGGPTPAARQPGAVHGNSGYTGANAAGNKNAETLQVLVTAAGAGRAPSNHNLVGMSGEDGNGAVAGGDLTSRGERASIEGKAKKGKGKKGNK